MQTEHLEYLVDLSQTKSFSKTAKRYYTSHQTISYGINRLEKEFEIKILNRTNHGIEFTPAGIIFLEFAQRILSQKADYEVKLLPHKEIKVPELSGHFNIFLSPRFANKNLAEFIDHFKCQYPKCSFSFMTQAVYSIIGPIEALKKGNDISLFSISTDIINFKDLKKTAKTDNINIKILMQQSLGYVLTNNSPYFNAITGMSKEELSSLSYISYNNSFGEIKQEFKLSCVDDSEMLKKCILSRNYIGLLTPFEYRCLFENHHSITFIPAPHGKPILYLIAYRPQINQKPLFTIFGDKLKNMLLSKNQ